MRAHGAPENHGAEERREQTHARSRRRPKDRGAAGRSFAGYEAEPGGSRRTTRFFRSALSTSASLWRRPITEVSMNEGKWPVCPLCEAPVTSTDPVGPPMADRRVVHLRCWIRKRQGVTDGTGSGE